MIEKTIIRINDIIEFIKETKEYYSDGVNEELIDMLNNAKKPLENLLKGKNNT